MKLTNKLGLALLALLLTQVPATAAAPKGALRTVVLTKDNLIVLNGEVNGESTSEVISKAKELDAKAGTSLVSGKAPLYLFLNTPGGSIQAGLEMIETLQGLGRKVNTVTLFSASMGFQIAQNLDDRLIIKSGVLMSHHAAGEFSGSFGGVPTQLDSRYQLWLDRIRELDEQTVKRTKGKQTYDSYTKQYDHEMWLTGAKSVAQGYADETVLVSCDASLNGVTTHSVMVPLFNVLVNYDLDNCPMNTTPRNIRVANPDGKSSPILSAEQFDEVKRRFLESFVNKEKQVIPMYW